MPENPPVNVTAVLNGTEVLMTWEGPPGKLNGELQGYMVEYHTPAAQQVSLGHVKSQSWAPKLAFVLTTVAFSVDSFMWIPDWTLSCQSTCRRRCPMCLSEFVPIPGQGGGPGPPHRLWLLSVLVSAASFMYIQQIKTTADIVWINDEKYLPFLCSYRNGGI